MNDAIDNMEEKILAWLNNNGYPLEMRIARALAVNEFDVTQSHFYKDFETNEPREIDVIGRLYDYIEPKSYVAIAELETFVDIECKSTSKPWVVFCESKPRTWNIEQALCNEAGKKLLIRSRKNLKSTILVQNGNVAGHGVAQAFGGGEDAPYKAVMSALKAAEAKARDSLERELNDKENNKNTEISLSNIVIAAVAISSPLFECSINESGEMELKRVENSALVFRYPRGRNDFIAGAIVHIVTEPGWQKFMDGIKEFHDATKKKLETMIPPEDSCA